jgi:hypothetical protein
MLSVVETHAAVNRPSESAVILGRFGGPSQSGGRFYQRKTIAAPQQWQISGVTAGLTPLGVSQTHTASLWSAERRDSGE